MSEQESNRGVSVDIHLHAQFDLSVNQTYSTVDSTAQETFGWGKPNPRSTKSRPVDDTFLERQAARMASKAAKEEEKDARRIHQLLDGFIGSPADMALRGDRLDEEKFFGLFPWLKKYIRFSPK